MQRPRFASALHTGGSLDDALADVGDQLSAGLDGAAPDLIVLFVAPAYGAGVEDAGARLADRLQPPAGSGSCLVGCSGGGVLATGGEVESGPAISALAGVLPGASLHLAELRHDELLTETRPDALRAALGGPRATDPFLLTFVDPFTLDSDLVLACVAEAFPGAGAVGGLASGGVRPGTHVLYADRTASRFGGVVLAVHGLSARYVVSQGCRPIGRRFVITRAEENKILALSGQPALDAIQDVVRALPDADRELARTNLLFGRVTHEARPDFGRGDFLIRNLVGVLPEEGAVLVGDRIRVGQTVQFQLRDRATAEEDLEFAMAGEIDRNGPAGAALVFTCAGRGGRFFGAPDHDVRAVVRHTGAIPLAGFFGNGEIGPVGPGNFVHGFSAAIALL